MRLGVSFIFITCLFMIVTGCKKSDKNSPVEPPIKIEGFTLFDYSGNTMGRIGPVDSDWQFINWASLTALEQSLLNSADTTNIANTVEGSVAIAAFPNPVGSSSAIYINSTDSVKFKMVITDSTGTILKTYSKKHKGAATIMFDLSDKNQYPNKKSLRYYYSFSAASKPHFKVGFGDIKICEYNLGQQPVTECFQ
jgi:hypothetical protein